MREERTTENSFALTRRSVNAVIAVLVFVAGGICYSFYLAEHISENTVVTLSNVHDLSDALLAPVLTCMIMLLCTDRTLGRFLGYTYLVFVAVGIAASYANALIFDQFGFTQYEILPRVLYTVPIELVLFTILAALFISGEAIVREVSSRQRRRNSRRRTTVPY